MCVRVCVCARARARMYIYIVVYKLLGSEGRRYTVHVLIHVSIYDCVCVGVGGYAYVSIIYISISIYIYMLANSAYGKLRSLAAFLRSTWTYEDTRGPQKGSLRMGG